MRLSSRLALALVLLLLPAAAVADPFAGLDFDGDLDCETATGDMGRIYTSDEVGDTISFRPFFDAADSMISFGCVFCVKDRAKVSFLSWEYDTPEDWTDIPILTNDGGIRGDLRVGDLLLRRSEWIETLYPDSRCWIVQSTDFGFTSPIGLPHGLGAFEFVVAEEGPIEWIIDGANAAYLTPDLETIIIAEDGSTCGEQPPLEIPPLGPDSCVASDGFYGGVQLTWTDRSSLEDGYRVRRDGEVVVDLPANSTAYMDTPAPGTYTYEIRAFNEFGESEACTDEGSALPIPPPPPPENCTASDDEILRVVLGWDDVSDEEAGYRIRRNGGVIVTLPMNVTTYVDNVAAGEYLYTIASLNVGGESEPCSTMGVSGERPVPAPPTECAASDDDDALVLVTWIDASLYEDGFRVYRDGSRIAQLPNGTTSFTDVPSPGTYTYEVSAYNTIGESERCADEGTRPFDHHFAGLDADGDLDCEPASGDLGREYDVAEVGDTVLFEPFFDTPDSALSWACTFCVRNKGRVSFIDWEYETPDGWAGVGIQTVDGPHPEYGAFEVSDWIISTYPSYRCWRAQSTDFSGAVPMSFPAPLGVFRFEVAAEGAIEWLIDGAGTAYLTTSYQTVVFDGDGNTCFLGPPPPLPPSQPTMCTATDDDTASVTIAWQDESENEDGFRVRRDGVLVCETAANVVSCADEVPSGTYEYQVRAFNDNGESGACVTDGSAIPAPRIWIVRANGSGDAPTLQAAADSARDGDGIRLMNGVFTGAGNRNVRFHGKAVEVVSEALVPKGCVIDCEGAGRAFIFDEGEGPGTMVRGITVRNGSAGRGGGVFGDGSPAFERCVFESCDAESAGGAVAWDAGAPSFTRCLFVGNGAPRGGAFDAAGGAPLLHRCTFARNVAADEMGGAVYAASGATMDGTNLLIASGEGGGAAACGAGGVVTLSCSDLWSNAGGDWMGCVAGQEGANGNVSVDPRFCDAPGDYRLRVGSPCATDSACGLIGAYGVGCTRHLSWEAMGSGKTDEVAGDASAEPPLFRVAPNPARGGATILFARRAPGGVSVGIYDVSGRFVRSFRADTASGAVVWDGRNVSGESVGPGVYFIRLEDGRGVDTRRLVLVR